MTTIDLTIEKARRANAIKRARERNIIIPTYAQMKDPSKIPANVKDDPTPPQLVLSNLSLFNRPEEKLDYNGFIPETEEITLPYDQNDLRFDYVGLQFNEPLKNTYKYILENFDEDRVDAGTQRNATYTNLNAGEYIFRVKAANRDGI